MIKQNVYIINYNSLYEILYEIKENLSFNIIKFIIKQDVIFIDPPWGGSIYKTKKKVDLYLDDINISEIVDSLYNYTNLLV